MSWARSVDELERRRAFALEMGGPERLARQKEQGKLNARERVAGLIDEDSFEELGSLAGVGSYIEGQLERVMPSAGVIGLARLNGRTVAVDADDFTARGIGGHQKAAFIERMAEEYRIPLVMLLDGFGAAVSGGEVKAPNPPGWGARSMSLLGEVPVVTAIMGSSAGWPAARAMLAHFVVIVKGTGQMFAAGPPVVRRAIGREISKEELGGSEVHARFSGCAHNEAESEEEAFRLIRRFLSFLPQNVWELPPDVEPTDDPNRRAEELLSIVPESRMRAYDMRQLVRHVVDNGDLFEIQPQYGLSVITGLARLNGHTVGILASNPMHLGGAIDGPAADKQTHFIEMCDSFHIPLVYFVDVPGLMVGPQAEREGTLRRGMRAAWTLFNATVPEIQVIVRKCYGMAGAATNNSARMTLQLAWPSAEWGNIPIQGGVDAQFRREIENAPDPAARRRELEEQLLANSSPFRSAEQFGIHDIIDPRVTRETIIKFLEAAIPARAHNLGPKQRIGVRP